MAYLGAYLGAGTTNVTVIVSSGATLTPVASPYTPGQPGYVNHFTSALNRLCEQFRSGDLEITDSITFDYVLDGGMP
jgi:hypothetical protein